MAGDTRIFEDSYELEGAPIVEPFIFVVRGTDGQKCRAIATATPAERAQILGVVQQTGVVGDQVLVRKIGHSCLKMATTANPGDRVTASTTNPREGFGEVTARPAVPTPNAAEINALVDWAAITHPATVVGPVPSIVDGVALVYLSGIALV